MSKIETANPNNKKIVARPCRIVRGNLLEKDQVEYIVSTAEVAKLADAQASGACASQGRGGSNPPFRTKITNFLRLSSVNSADSIANPDLSHEKFSAK